MMTIKCCRPCKAPKRYPGCHDHCEEYLKEKEAHNQRLAELAQDRGVSAAIYTDRGRKVEKAMRKRRSYKR